MSFCSIQFVLFFIIVFLLYFTVFKRKQWVLLLGASCYFYMCWEPGFIILIFISIGISYITARMMERWFPFKKLCLVIGICANLSILFFFKYSVFFCENISELFRLINISIELPVLNIILPMGISFYTFQTISYLIEVYYGNIIAEKHLGHFALFVTFFPQLVAGPIERAQDLLPQLCSIHRFSYEKAVYGTKLMAWGYFKKMVVADTLAIYVNRVYNDVTSINSGMTFMIATFFFAVQLYCDFSAYSDIARGCAKIIGIELTINFKSPVFFSKSIKEYWRRHHISLSNWFTSYVYIPLGGNKRGLIRQYFNNTVTFLLSGLWHGADWTFIVWGGGAQYLYKCRRFFAKGSK